MISRKREITIILSVFVFFLALHFAGLHISYHQDEYKWVGYAHLDLKVLGAVPHPPLTEFIYTKFGRLVGDNNFRVIPFVFGSVDLILVYILARILFDRRTALWTIFLFTFSYYSLLASLMVDTDGTIIPFFFLIMTIAYCKLRAKNFEFRGNWFYIIAFIVGAVGGFFIKVSGVLPIAALALDFAIEKGIFKDIKKVVRYVLFGLLSLLVLGALLYFSKFVFSYFSLGVSMKYWEHFANSSSFLNRGWLQTFIEFGKSILYTSPLLIVPALFIDKEIWKKTRPLFLFLCIDTIFYLFVFDFSLGALDRYFQFFV